MGFVGSMTDVGRTFRPPGNNVHYRCAFHMVITSPSSGGNLDFLIENNAKHGTILTLA